MNNTAEQIEALEISIEQTKEAIAMLDALKALEKNKHFKKLISEGYFRDEASRLVLLKADPSMASPEHQKLLEDSIIACGHFRQYLSSVYQLGNMAAQALLSDEATREELLAGE